MSVTIASDHFPCLKQLHLTNSHTCAHKHACLKHLHQTNIYICYSNIQPSVLSVGLATDQRRSNGCFNFTGQAGLYQPAVKMVMNICSMQLPYSGVVFCVDTLGSISLFCKFSPSIQLTFSYIHSKKVCTLIKHSVEKFSVISSVQYTLSLSLHFFKKCFPKVGIFMRII